MQPLLNGCDFFDLASGKHLAGTTEEDTYHFLQLKYIPPEQQLDKEEIEKPF